MADTAVLLEIITYIFQRTPPTADCDEPLMISHKYFVKQMENEINYSAAFTAAYDAEIKHVRIKIKL